MRRIERSGCELLHVANAFAVGLPEPFLVGEIVLEILHVLAGRDAEPGQERIGEQRFADALAEVVDGGGLFWPGDAVFAFGAPHEDVPREEIDLDAPVVGVLHDRPPKSRSSRRWSAS